MPGRVLKNTIFTNNITGIQPCTLLNSNQLTLVLNRLHIILLWVQQSKYTDTSQRSLFEVSERSNSRRCVSYASRQDSFTPTRSSCAKLHSTLDICASCSSVIGEIKSELNRNILTEMIEKTKDISNVCNQVYSLTPLHRTCAILHSRLETFMSFQYIDYILAQNCLNSVPSTVFPDLFLPPSPRQNRRVPLPNFIEVIQLLLLHQYGIYPFYKVFQHFYNLLLIPLRRNFSAEYYPVKH